MGVSSAEFNFYLDWSFLRQGQQKFECRHKSKHIVCYKVDEPEDFFVQQRLLSRNLRQVGNKPTTLSG